MSHLRLVQPTCRHCGEAKAGISGFCQACIRSHGRIPAAYAVATATAALAAIEDCRLRADLEVRVRLARPLCAVQALLADAIARAEEEDKVA